MRPALTLAALFALAACSSPRQPATPPPTQPTVEALPAPGAFASPFFPADYQASMFTDYAAMRDCGLLAYFERMPMMSSYLEADSAAYGCSADDVDRVRTAMVFDDTGSSRMRIVSVSVAETAAREPKPPDKSWDLEPAAFGKYSGFRPVKSVATYPGARLWAGNGVAVYGDLECLQALCDGVRPAGGPHQDLLPLLGGERVLCQFVLGRFGQEIWRMTGTIGFPFPFDKEDPVEFVRLRLQLDADGDLVLSILFRYLHGSSGLRDCEQWVRVGLDTLLGRADMAPFKKLLGAIVTEHKGRDLTMRIALGEPRDAVRAIEQAVLALMAMRSERDTRR